MAIATRDKRGRASSSYRPEQLYGLVRVIAQQAKPGHPEAISVREFDKARVATGHDDAPSARAICQRLADREGKAMSWKRVKEVAFDEQASIEHVERRRRAAAPADYLSDRAVYFALRLIAKRLDVKTLTPGAYEEERLVVLREEKRRDPRRLLMAQLLPTVGQIEQHFAGNDDDDASWDSALAVAELEPRARRFATGKRPASLSLVVGIHLFVEFNDELPSRERFEKFADQADIQVEAPNKQWREHVGEAVAYRRSLGFYEPTALPKSRGGAGGTKKLPAVKAPAPGSIPGTIPRERKGRSKHSREALIAAIQAYLEDLDCARPTQKGYGRYAVKNELPAPSNFAKHGGWRILLDEARGE